MQGRNKVLAAIENCCWSRRFKGLALKKDEYSLDKTIKHNCFFFKKKLYYLCFKNLKPKKELQMIKNIMQSTFGETDANA